MPCLITPTWSISPPPIIQVSNTVIHIFSFIFVKISHPAVSLLPVSMTPMTHLVLRVSPIFGEKFKMVLKAKDPGKDDSCS
jgi:hypothetical protein